MLPHDIIKSHILISTDIEKEVDNFKNKLYPFRIVEFIEEKFKLEHAKAVVAEAYISESQTKYIILGSQSFGIEAQNSLLKLLEEPPKNIEFIIQFNFFKRHFISVFRIKFSFIKMEVTCNFHFV